MAAELVIKGVQKTSLIDFPGRICATVFVSRCNFRCRFCHNPELVLDEPRDEVDQDELIAFLTERKRWLDGICMTGGEPLLHPGLAGFLERVKAIGLLVKLDTNGSMPKTLRMLLDKGLIDYVAMDIKSDKEHYSDAAGVGLKMDEIEKSITLIKSSGIDYEFRTTAVPMFFNAKIARNIGEWLRGSRLYVIQQFVSTHRMLDESLHGSESYSRDQLNEFAGAVASCFSRVEIRAR